MARYLLVEFEDDKQAEAMVSKIDAATEAGKRFRVVGLFGKPTQFCECEAPGKGARGAKYGWIVNLCCRKAQKGSQVPRNLLLDPDLPAKNKSLFLHVFPALNVYEFPGFRSGSPMGLKK